MTSALHDFTVIEHQNLICLGNGFQTVGNQNHGLLFRERGNGVHQLVLIFRIHVCGGFVQEN